MRFRAVLFDLDGTLLDTLEDLRTAVNAAMRAGGFPEHSLEGVRARVGRGLRALAADAAPAGTPPDAVERCLAVLRREYAAHMNDATRPYPGVAAMLARLRALGVRTGVVSNKDDAAVERLVRAHFGADVDLCAGTRPGGPLKPAPDTALALLRSLGAQAREAAFVGDSGIDVETAANAGLPFFGVAWGFWGRERLEAAGAGRVLGTAEELFAALSQERR